MPIQKSRRLLLALPLLALMPGCGKQEFTARSAGAGTDAVQVRLTGPADFVAVTISDLDTADGLAVVGQAFAGYTAALTGGADCWGDQTNPFDGDSSKALVVRRNAQNCGLALTVLRYQDPTGIVTLRHQGASGLAATPGAVGNFASADREFQLAATVVQGLRTSAAAEIKLRGKESAIDAVAHGVIKSCMTPWGTEIEDSSQVTAYEQATVPYGSQCRSGTLICSNGVLANADLYRHPTCTVNPRIALVVTRQGSGTGQVTGGGISCGQTCSLDFKSITTVTLTATPEAGMLFKGWSGACAGTDASCTVAVDRVVTVTATFDRDCVQRGSFTIGNGNPFHFTALVAEAISTHHLPYSGIDTSLPIQRSSDAWGSGYVWHSTGTPDPARMTELCQILGYNAYESSTCHDTERSGRYPGGKCNFHSPDNNSMLAFDAGLNRFNVIGAAPKYGNTWIASMVCRDRNICR